MRILAAGAIVLMAGAGCAGVAPPEKPVVEPPVAATIVGAWGSVSLKGPGSASFRRMDLILHGDGRFDFVGEAGDGARIMLGRYTWADETLTLVRQDGTTLRFGCRKDGPMLVLRDGGAELRLAPLQP